MKRPIIIPRTRWSAQCPRCGPVTATQRERPNFCRTKLAGENWCDEPLQNVRREPEEARP